MNLITFSKLCALKVTTGSTTQAIAYCTGHDFVRNYWGMYPHAHAFYMTSPTQFQAFPKSMVLATDICFDVLRDNPIFHVVLFTGEKNMYYSMSKSYLDLPELSF